MSRHGYSRTKEYRAWQDAKQRCYKTEHTEYKRYGAIGITMSDEFINNPKAWCEYVGKAPDNTPRKWSIDRIDCTKGYERGNLRWTTSDIQTRNQKKQRNNTSGETGVTWNIGRNGRAALATAWWYDIDGNTKSKSFSVRKLGLLEAFANAVRFRRAMIKELNSLGAGYSENHGK